MRGTDSQESGLVRTDRSAIDCDTALLDVHQVAGLLNCSSRHVYRLCDSGSIPQPVRLGALIRWSRTAIAQWIDEGCPACR
jgi:excisionase family DNA binding protein